MRSKSSQLLTVNTEWLERMPCSPHGNPRDPTRAQNAPHLTNRGFAAREELQTLGPRRDHDGVEQDLGPRPEHRRNEMPLVLVRNGFRREG